MGRDVLHLLDAIIVEYTQRPSMGDCISCGSKIPKESRFCPGCGSVVGEESDTQLGRRLSDVRDEISASQDAIEKAKTPEKLWSAEKNA